MPDDSKGKGFPDVNNKLNALPKKSLFERQKAEAEAKRARERAETAAVYEDFVKSFEDEPEARPSDTRTNTFGQRGGGFGGGPSRRHFTSSGPRASGPGTLGPPPPSLSRKRTHEGFSRNRDSAQGVLGFDQPGTGPSGPSAVFRNASDDEEERRPDTKEAERAAAKPTIQLSSLPPGTSLSVVKALMPSFLVVDDVHFIRPTGQVATERASTAAIVTLASDTAASEIDSAVSSLQNKYLGRGYYLSISRHLSSAAIKSNLSTISGLSNSSPLPFGARPVQPNLGSSLSRAPPPNLHRGGIAPPNSFGPNTGRGGITQVEVKAPSDIKQLRLIHKTLENLLKYGPEFEALLMSRPVVARDEKWAWLWDARSLGGVYYRWKLWQTVTNPRMHGNRKPEAQKYTAIFDEGAYWMTPESHITFEYTTHLDEFVTDDDYNSSDEEQWDGEDEKRNLGGGPPDGAGGQQDGLGYMNPLQKAKLTHLLARLPTSNAKLRRGDIAQVTAFAIQHAGAGADEAVDMIVLNILRPLAYTAANPDRELEKEAVKPDSGEKDPTTSISSKELIDVSPAKLVGLYVISDILSSSATSGVRHAWRYRQLFESALQSHKVFEHLGRLEKDLNWGRLRAEKWKRSISTLLNMWEGWCVFPQASQEHFVRMFEEPPLTEEETKLEQEKAEADRAASAFSKGKSRWKAVEDEGDNHDLGLSEAGQNKLVSQDDVLNEESMSDIDGVPMEDSDAEDFDEGEPIEDEKPLEEVSNAQEPSPTGVQAPEQQETTTRRARKPRPKAEDMFASDSE